MNVDKAALVNDLEVNLAYIAEAIVGLENQRKKLELGGYYRALNGLRKSLERGDYDEQR